MTVSFIVICEINKVVLSALLEILFCRTCNCRTVFYWMFSKEGYHALLLTIIKCTTTDRCTCILATRFVIVKMCYPELYWSVHCSSLHGNVIYNVCLINANLNNIVIKDRHYRGLLRPLRSVRVCDMIIACSEIIWNLQI